MDDKLKRYMMADEERPVGLSAHEMSDLLTALLVAEDAAEAVREGKLTDYLRERLEDDEHGLTKDECKRWRKLRCKLTSEYQGHPSNIRP